MSWVRVRVFAPTMLLVALGGLPGCGGDELSRTDPRFATPERTVATLLAAHGAGGASQAELQERFVAQGGLTVVDREAYELCFADLGTPSGPALAQYVVGMIAAARDELRYETVDQHGYVVPRRGPRIVMRRGDDGAYRIMLAESVPEDARDGLTALEGSP